MIPIVLSMATIFHKIQGSTADYIASYLGKNIFALGQAYEMRSEKIKIVST